MPKLIQQHEEIANRFRFSRSGSSRGEARILSPSLARVVLRHPQSDESRQWRVSGLASGSLPRLRRFVWIADATALLDVFLLLRPVKRLPIRQSRSKTYGEPGKGDILLSSLLSIEHHLLSRGAPRFQRLRTAARKPETTFPYDQRLTGSLPACPFCRADSPPNSQGSRRFGQGCQTPLIYRVAYATLYYYPVLNLRAFL